jgi:opacity protein-like surface antigen
MNTFIKSTALIVLTGIATPALSADMYVAGTLGYFSQDSSKNKGSFFTDFTTGEVTGVSPPLSIPAGSPVGWSTNFDSGTAYSLALGWKLDTFRVEVEYAMSDADVKSHQGVNAAGIDLTNIDAGVLLTGNVGDLGVSVGDLVSDGRGSMETSTLFLNGYYDFMADQAFSPYLGVGVGYADTDVTYKPSGVGVISDSDTGFAYQFILGASYALNESFEIYGDARLRYTDDASVKSNLLSADFDVENSATLFNLGVRYSF